MAAKSAPFIITEQLLLIVHMSFKQPFLLPNLHTLSPPFTFPNCKFNF